MSSSAFVAILFLSLVLLAIFMFMKNKKEQQVKNANHVVVIPVDDIDVDEISNAINISLDIEDESPEVIEASGNAIINDLEEEVDEVLPSSLQPLPTDLELSGDDEAELRRLLEGETIVALGMAVLDLVNESVDKAIKLPKPESALPKPESALPKPESILERAQSLVVSVKPEPLEPKPVIARAQSLVEDEDTSTPINFNDLKNKVEEAKKTSEILSKDENVVDLIKEPAREIDSSIKSDFKAITVESKPISPVRQEAEKKMEKKEADLDQIKVELVKSEAKKIEKEVEFVNVQVENIEKVRKENKESAKKAEAELKEAHAQVRSEFKSDLSFGERQELEQHQAAEVLQLKTIVEKKDKELKGKAEKLVAISEEKVDMIQDSNSALVKKIKNKRHPRKSKKNVKSTTKENLDGSTSFKLEVPSDLSEGTIDEIDLVVSKDASETLTKYNEIKTKILVDKSLANVSDEEKEVIKSAGKEFKKIKTQYVNKRSEKIRNRVKSIKAKKSKVTN